LRGTFAAIEVGSSLTPGAMATVISVKADQPLDLVDF
jgi:hypothetical protein